MFKTDKLNDMRDLQGFLGITDRDETLMSKDELAYTIKNRASANSSYSDNEVNDDFIYKVKLVDNRLFYEYPCDQKKLKANELITEEELLTAVESQVEIVSLKKFDSEGVAYEIVVNVTDGTITYKYFDL